MKFATIPPTIMTTVTVIISVTLTEKITGIQYDLGDYIT